MRSLSLMYVFAILLCAENSLLLQNVLKYIWTTLHTETFLQVQFSCFGLHHFTGSLSIKVQLLDFTSYSLVLACQQVT